LTRFENNCTIGTVKEVAMTILGSVQVYIRKGQQVTGIAIIGENNKPIAGQGIIPIKPTEGDEIKVEFLEVPE